MTQPIWLIVAYIITLITAGCCLGITLATNRLKRMTNALERQSKSLEESINREIRMLTRILDVYDRMRFIIKQQKVPDDAEYVREMDALERIYKDVDKWDPGWPIDPNRAQRVQDIFRTDNWLGGDPE